MTAQLAILHSARLLVPRGQRPEWFAEWKAELEYVRQNAEGAATSFCLGAFRDAFWLRRNSLPSATPAAVLVSPYHCIAFLAVLAVATVFFPFRPLFQFSGRYGQGSGRLLRTGSGNGSGDCVPGRYRARPRISRGRL